MRKRLLAILLCFAMIFTPSIYTGFQNQIAFADENTDIAVVDTEKTEASPELSIYEQLVAEDTVESMYLLMLDFMENDPEGLKALTAAEISALRIRISELDPEQDDVDTQDLLDTLSVLPNGGEVLEGDPSYLDSTISGSQGWKGGSTLTENATWVFQNGAVVTFREPVTIPSGKTLTLKGYGGIARFSGTFDGSPYTNTQELFIVEAGGKLVIEGTSDDKPFTIDGMSVVAEKPMIDSSGTLNFTNAVIQNGKNRVKNSCGGGIRINADGSLTMENCTVTKNTAKQFGGGIYCLGTMTINNSVISYNVAATDSDEATNLGRGGGFRVSGANASCTLTGTIVENNTALYYGGGGQVDNKASITMNDRTVFRDNRAELHGAGALHLTADAKFYMNGGSMVNNYARYCGGAIHSSYSCVLELNKGEICDNLSEGRGGGIHINTGGAITLNENMIISGNQVKKKKMGTSADVDATGDHITNILYEGSDTDFGYGGGILMDSGTCTVAGATITGNYAEVGGGGIALTMLNMGDDGLDDYMVINFTMASGTVSGNRTDGNGAGVYMMSNKAEQNLKKVFTGQENWKGEKLTYEWALKKITETNKHGFTGEQIVNGIPVATVSGGTISDNYAETGNGGGLYLEENTKFIINETGDVSDNKSINGAGVYVASGTAEIDGGSMTGNVASANGGALYISGNVTMTDGIIGGDTEAEANTAVNGGAMYVTNGNVNIEHGVIDGNKALTNSDNDLQDTSNNTGRGGAVYLAGNKNTVLTMESGTMNKNIAENDGGAIFATGGTIYIGLEDCKKEKAGSTCSHHIDKGAGRYHPIIKENQASDTGGGIALTDGIVHFYCGKANDNQALYKGVGKNVFMDGGEFHLYDGADLGVPRDPDLVIVGGKLHNECVIKEYVNLYYYQSNAATTTDMVGLAEYEEIMNLPDGEYFWDAPEGYVFLGWTAQGAASGTQSNEYVRNKEQYVNSGEPVEIIDAESTETDQTAINTNKVFDGVTDTGSEGKIMHLYALWAPETSKISYVNGLTGATISNTETDPDNPETYDFSRASNVLQIQPVKQAGYDLVGWYIYQNAGQNANWNDTQKEYEELKYEPNYTGSDYSTQKTYIELGSPNGVLQLEAGNTNFGDITLVANFIPAYRDLVITKAVDVSEFDENQSFLFHVYGNPDNPDLADIDLSVVISGSGRTKISDLPIGQYTVREITDWSWRYGLAGVDCNAIVQEDCDDGKAFALAEILYKENQDGSRTKIPYQVDFTNVRQHPYWLSGDFLMPNLFNKTRIIF